MDHLRFMYSDPYGRRVQRLTARAHRRNSALLASIWATKIARELRVGEPSDAGRAARYASTMNGRERTSVPAWFPRDERIAGIVAVANTFVGLTHCLKHDRAITPNAALRKLQAQPTTYPADVVNALAAQFKVATRPIAA